MEDLDLELPVLQPPKREFRPMIYWYVTFRCNLACKHCWVNSSPTVDTSTDLTTEQMLAAVDRVAEFNPNRVVFTGGEPFVRKDFPQVLRRLNEKRIGYTIETNAMLITPEMAQIVRDARDQGIQSWCAVSLDGGTAEAHDWQRGKNSFDLTVRGIKRLVDAGVPVSVQCVINQRNVDTLQELGRKMAEVGVYHLSFVFSNPVGRAIEYFDQLALPLEVHNRAFENIADVIKLFPGQVTVKVPPATIPPHMLERLVPPVAGDFDSQVKNTTSCAFPLLGILPDGQVTICALTRDMADSNFGHVLNLSLRDIWVRKGLDELRDRYERAELTGICGDCVFKQVCKGACRAHAATDSGSYEGPYPLCAEMERQGRFPNVYRLSYRQQLTEQWRERMANRQANAAAAQAGD